MPCDLRAPNRLADHSAAINSQQLDDCSAAIPVHSSGAGAGHSSNLGQELHTPEAICLSLSFSIPLLACVDGRVWPRRPHMQMLPRLGIKPQQH